VPDDSSSRATNAITPYLTILDDEVIDVSSFRIQSQRELVSTVARIGGAAERAK
jgi:hypothetical protein